MSRHYGEALAKDKLKLLAELIERAQIGQNELNEARQAAGKPKLDNKWKRGVNVVKTAPDYSPLLPKFLNKINDGKNVSHQEIYAAFEYIRKADDQLLAKLKITKGDEIHHALGYAEFARSVEQLSPNDQVKAFAYLSANDFPLGTTPSNTKFGALGKIAHRNPDAAGNPDYLSAHFKNNGVPLQLDTIPTNFDEWVDVWENKIVPQAYTGAAVGRLVDGERVNKIFEAMEADPESLAKIAQKHGTTPDQIVSAIFTREAIEDIGDSPTLKASREYAKKIGLDNTMSSFIQGKANERLILDQLGEAGFNPDVVQRQLQTPESIDRSILRVDPREALDNTTRLIRSGGGIKTNSIQRRLAKQFADAAGEIPIAGYVAGPAFGLLLGQSAAEAAGDAIPIISEIESDNTADVSREGNLFVDRKTNMVMPTPETADQGKQGLAYLNGKPVAVPYGSVAGEATTSDMFGAFVNQVFEVQKRRGGGIGLARKKLEREEQLRALPATHPARSGPLSVGFPMEGGM
jgi:hypothetical protein